MTMCWWFMQVHAGRDGGGHRWDGQRGSTSFFDAYVSRARCHHVRAEWDDWSGIFSAQRGRLCSDGGPSSRRPSLTLFRHPRLDRVSVLIGPFLHLYLSLILFLSLSLSLWFLPYFHHSPTPRFVHSCFAFISDHLSSLILIARPLCPTMSLFYNSAIISSFFFYKHWFW